MALGAGQRDKLIRIERRTASQAEAGSREVSESWDLISEEWANVAPAREGASGGEDVEAGQPSARQFRIFTIRHREEVSPSQKIRIVFNGWAFDIVGVEEIGRREEMRVTAYARAEVSA